MKIIHTADWHLGKKFYEQYLTDDQAWLLSQLIEVVKQEKPQAIVIAGDLYDRAIPPTEAVTLLDETLSALATLGVPVIAISGNHDSAERLDFGQALMRQAGVYMVGEIRRDEPPIVLQDEWGEVYCCPFAFAEPERVRLVFDDEEIHTYEDVMRTQVKQFLSQIPSNARKVAIAHAFIAGGLESESERTLSVGGTDQVGYRVFDDFDYVMLGHLHRPQSVGVDHIRYSGSLMKYSFDEAGHDKGIDIVDIREKGHVTRRRVSLQPLRDVRVLEGTWQEILHDMAPTEDYVMAKLTEPTVEVDMMKKLRQRFPNAMRIEYPQRTYQGREVTGYDVRETPKVELFAQFVKDMRGVGLSADEEAIMESVWVQIAEEERA